jgi:branched-chain amino acid aminotransferase
VSFDKTEWVWMSGKLVRWNEATVHVSAHGLHYGSGVFEGMRCYETEEGPALFRLDAHLDRLFYSAAVYGLAIPYSHEEISEAICETIQKNDFTSCYVRPICFYGSGALGVNPSRCPVETVILVWPWGAYLGDDALERGVKVTISSWTKFHSRMLPTTAKACGGYMNSILAVSEAARGSFDEAILLDAEGNIAEGAGENLFIVRDGRVITNDERSSILLGITRDSCIKIARDLGYRVEVRPIRMKDLYSADEAFFTGTAAEVTPIREVDGTVIGSGERPVTERIKQAYFDAVNGRDEKYKGWLRYVERRGVGAGI